MGNIFIKYFINSNNNFQQSGNDEIHILTLATVETKLCDLYE